jgi:hypothetical protein
MKLGEGILKILGKVYDPETMIEKVYKNFDLAFKTDAEGRPILLFLGKKQENGQIKGERFARRYKVGTEGAVIKDHWDYKGKAT